MTIPLFEINPHLDRALLARRFAATGRVQVQNLLTDAAARELVGVLARNTPWGEAWQTGHNPPHAVRYAELRAMTAADRENVRSVLATAMLNGDYAFQYGHYPMLDAYLQQWDPQGPLELVLEHINDAPFLELVRAITAIPELQKADAQATLYAPGHFLAQHDDSHVAEGWRIAYVLNLCPVEWRPDWGGYLNFFDEDGDIIQGFRPRFNALNMFRVPQKHNVAYVPPFAPVARFAITGWFRDS